MWVKIEITLLSGKELTVYHKTGLLNSTDIVKEFLGDNVSPTNFSSVRFSQDSFGVVKTSEIASLKVDTGKTYQEYGFE